MTTPNRKRKPHSNDILEASAKKNKSLFSNKADLALGTYQADYLSAIQSGMNSHSITNLLKSKFETLTDEALTDLESAVFILLYCYLFLKY